MTFQERLDVMNLDDFAEEERDWVPEELEPGYDRSDLNKAIDSLSCHT